MASVHIEDALCARSWRGYRRRWDGSLDAPRPLIELPTKGCVERRCRGSEGAGLRVDSEKRTVARGGHRRNHDPPVALEFLRAVVEALVRVSRHRQGDASSWHDANAMRAHLIMRICRET